MSTSSADISMTTFWEVQCEHLQESMILLKVQKAPSLEALSLDFCFQKPHVNSWVFWVTFIGMHGYCSLTIQLPPLSHNHGHVERYAEHTIMRLGQPPADLLDTWGSPHVCQRRCGPSLFVVGFPQTHLDF